MPLRTGKGSYPQAFDVLKEMALDGMELEFVHGVRMSDANRDYVKEQSNNFVITAHGPFYINLNSKEEEKILAKAHEMSTASSDIFDMFNDACNILATLHIYIVFFI